MFFFTVKFNRKTAVAIILAAAAVLIALIIIFSRSGDAESVLKSGGKVECAEDRIAYLKDLGWEVDAASETEKTVLIPREFAGIYLEYNKLQKEQGFDLAKYPGTEVSMFSYIVTNYESADTVIATLYVHKNRVIAGDIHSTTLSGFMHALK